MSGEEKNQKTIVNVVYSGNGDGFREAYKFLASKVIEKIKKEKLKELGALENEESRDIYKG